LLYWSVGRFAVYRKMLFEKLKQVRSRIAEAAEKAGRDPEQIELVAVTKYAQIEDIRTLLASGMVRYVGENRVQVAQEHHTALGAEADKAYWRFIGHLQTNKVNAALKVFSAFDAVDSLKLAEALNTRLGEMGKIAPVMVQVKLTDKESQSGIAPADVEEFIGAVRKLPHLAANGLMAIAPMADPVENVRPYFRKMRELFETHFPERGAEGPYLSMGMSRDYHIAVEEGANLVRVGSALFAEN
jgi:pyridoxal phosphate enzyme (YggS family)